MYTVQNSSYLDNANIVVTQLPRMFIRQTRISNNRSFPHQGNSYTGILHRIQPGFALCDPIAFRKILYIFSEI